MGFLKDFIESEKSSLACATVATPATFRPGVATVATVAVAKLENRVGEISRDAEFTKAPAYNLARLQREADRRNAKAAREGITDRFCRCGHLATFAWPGADGRDVWICDECAPTRGVA